MKRRAFTLIELLVIIAVIGLLATVVLVSLRGVKSSASYTKVRQDVNAIIKAAELYYDSTGAVTYPHPAEPGSSWKCLGKPTNQTCQVKIGSSEVTLNGSSDLISKFSPWIVIPFPPDCQGADSSYYYSSTGVGDIATLYWPLGPDMDTSKDCSPGQYAGVSLSDACGRKYCWFNFQP